MNNSDYSKNYSHCCKPAKGGVLYAADVVSKGNREIPRTEQGRTLFFEKGCVMTEISTLTARELFEIKARAGKDKDALKTAECLFEAHHEGYEQAIKTSATSLGSEQEGRGAIARSLLAVLPKYEALPATSTLLFVEIIRAWIVASDEEKETLLADSFVFARFSHLPDIVRNQVVSVGEKTVKKVYRIFGRLDLMQMRHNGQVVSALVGALRNAPAEHFIIIGKIMSVMSDPLYFLNFRLPKLLEKIKNDSSA